MVNLNTSQMLQAQGALVNLSEGATPEQLGIYFENLLESSSVGGDVYAFSWYQPPTELMYNKAIFEQARLDPEAALEMAATSAKRPCSRASRRCPSPKTGF